MRELRRPGRFKPFTKEHRYHRAHVDRGAHEGLAEGAFRLASAAQGLAPLLVPSPADPLREFRRENGPPTGRKVEALHGPAAFVQVRFGDTERLAHLPIRRVRSRHGGR